MSIEVIISLKAPEIVVQLYIVAVQSNLNYPDLVGPDLIVWIIEIRPGN